MQKKLFKRRRKAPGPDAPLKRRTQKSGPCGDIREIGNVRIGDVRIGDVRIGNVRIGDVREETKDRTGDFPRAIKKSSKKQHGLNTICGASRGRG
jgi:hypothetical protein